ncbi:MAG: clostripain-related cysteine peptidase [Pseudomonadales bacterium]
MQRVLKPWLRLAACAWLLSWAALAGAAAGTQVDWTLMFYIAADNDLEGAALKDLDEIEAGLPESGVEAIVFIDRAKGYSDAAGDWTDARVLRMRPDRERGVLDLDELVRLGEVNTGDPKTLSDFVRFASSRYPARRYGLVLWNHGGGWQGMADDEDPGNGEGHDNLSVVEVGNALRGALPDGRKFDLIGFDMCLMAQLEMAYEVADLAEFMVASQAVEPSYGWPYDVLLPEFGHATVGPRRLAQNIVRKYGEFTDGRSEEVATQSAIDLARLEPVRGALDALADRLRGVSGQYWPSLSRALFWADSFEVGGKTANLERGENALASSDLLDMVKRMRTSLGERFPAEAEFHRLVEAVDGAILDNHTSRRHRLSHGLSIYAPPNAGAFNDAYASSRFGRDSRWPALLHDLHARQQANRAAPRVTAMSYVRAGTRTPVTDSSMLDNTTLKVTVQGDNLLWVSGLVGRYSQEDKGYLIYSRGYLADSRYLAEKLATSGSAAELLMPEFRGSTAEMEMEVAPATYAVSNGERAAFATLDASGAQIGQGTSATIEALYKSRTQGEHRAIISFDLRTWKATGVILLVQQEDGRIVPRAAEPEADDEVTLLYEFLPDDGDGELKRMKGVTFPWKDGLELIMDEVPNGTYRTWAIAENLSGEKHVGHATVNVVAPQRDIKAGFDGARQRSIRDLGGVWSTVNGQEVLRIGEPLSADSNIARMMINEEMIAPEMRDYQFVVQFDTRLLPTIHLITFDESGNKILGRETYMVLANPAAPDRLWIKSLVGGGGDAVGEIIELARTSRPQPAPQPAPGPGPQPGPDPYVPQPDNGPATLIGIWEGRGPYGYIWVQFAGNGEYRQVETAFDNSVRVESWGTFALQGNYMQLRPMGGQSCGPYGCQPVYPPQMAPFPFQISGGVLQTPVAQLARQR